MITFDARGSGTSGHPPAGYRFADHAADAIAVLDATGTGTASLVAASRGANVAVLVAADLPERIDRLVLVQPGMEMTEPADDAGSVDSAEDDLPDWRTDYQAFVTWFITEVFPEPDSQATIDEVIGIALEGDLQMLRQQATELDRTQAPARLTDVRCPTLVIHGTADRLAELRDSRAIAAQVSGARFVPLEGLGHRPDIRRPDIVVPIIADFISAAAPVV